MFSIILTSSIRLGIDSRLLQLRTYARSVKKLCTYVVEAAWEAVSMVKYLVTAGTL